MNKKVSINESSNVFYLTALKLLISVIAISLASIMSGASKMPTNILNSSPAVSIVTKVKDLLPCPIPYATEFCLKDESKKSCEREKFNFLQSLNSTPFTKNVIPYCSISETAVGKPQES